MWVLVSEHNASYEIVRCESRSPTLDLHDL